METLKTKKVSKVFTHVNIRFPHRDVLAKRLYYPTIPKGSVCFHWPLVKSGNCCGIPSSATDFSLSGLTALQKHPSYTFWSKGNPFRKHSTIRYTMIPSIPPCPDSWHWLPSACTADGRIFHTATPVALPAPIDDGLS